MNRSATLLLVFAMPVAIFLATSAIGGTEEIPRPVSYVIKTYVAEIDKARSAQGTGNEPTRSGAARYALMQLNQTVSQCRQQIPLRYRDIILTNANALLKDVSGGKQPGEGSMMRSWFLALCPGG